MDIRGLGERLQLLVEKFTQNKISQFARETGIARSSLYLYLGDKNAPDAETLAKIASFTGCDLNWLVTGNGTAPGGEPPEAEMKPASPVNMDRLASAIRALEEVAAREQITLTPEKKANLVALIYELETDRKDKIEGAALSRLIGLGR